MKFNVSLLIPITGIILLIAAVVLFILDINPLNLGNDPHAAHKQLASSYIEGQTGSSVNTLKIPGLNGDRTKRYTVSFLSDPEKPEAQVPVLIRFKVYDASTGLPVNLFQTIYEKKMHFIITNNDLTYFEHIHPEYKDGEFSITKTFPKSDMYHLYIQFQPFGGIEQQVGFSLKVGDVPSPFSTVKTDDKETKTFGEYKVSVDTHGTLKSRDMSEGLQKISFTIKDAATGKPVTNLKPYLASFGHLSLINQKTFEFIHVHPYDLTPPKPDASGGPTVDFLPIGIYGPFKKGVYRAFAEFAPSGKLFTADFTLEIQ